MQKFKTVDAIIASLDKEKQLQCALLRESLLTTHNQLHEHIKWNAPSYVLDGQDRVTFNTMNRQGVLKVILHMGAIRKEDKTAQPIFLDSTGLVAWSSDIRGVITFTDLDDVKTKLPAFYDVVQQWLAIPATL